ncbi:MAG: hypothetical protein WBA10_07820, partial [Elainellaceae cyanobacterium]
ASILCIISGFTALLNRENQLRQDQHSETMSTKLRGRSRWLMIWLVILMWIQILIAINEYGHSRYLIPAVGLCGFLLVLMVVLVESTEAYRRRIPHSAPILCILIYALCISISIYQYGASYNRISSGFAYHSRQLEEIERLLGDTQYEGCVVALERRASNPRSALFYGNGWANLIFSNTLSELHPNSIFLRRGTLNPSKPIKFQQYDGSKISTSELFVQGNGCVLLQGRAELKNNNDPYIQGEVTKDAAFENLLPKQVETLYRIKLIYTDNSTSRHRTKNGASFLS